MFDIGFSELLLIFVVGLVVLGPQRMPVAIRTVMKWINTVRGLAANVQNELTQELKLQELQESIKKAENLNLRTLSPELAKTVEDLKQSAQKIKADLDNQVATENQNLEEQIKEMREDNFQANNSTNTTSVEHTKKVESAGENHQENLAVFQSSVSSPTDNLATEIAKLQSSSAVEQLQSNIQEELSLDEQLASYIEQYHPAEEIPAQSTSIKSNRHEKNA